MATEEKLGYTTNYVYIIDIIGCGKRMSGRVLNLTNVTPVWN